MKIFNQIAIVVIFTLLVVMAKTDYGSYYSNTISYLKNQINKTALIKRDNNINNTTVSEINNNNKEVSKIEQTPGALVVSDNLLTNNLKSIKLTKNGVIKITNEERSLNGNLPPLKENSKLDFSAEKKLQDMFVKGYFEHVSPSGVGVSDLANEVSYDYIIIGENLAMGNFKNDQALVDAWMASPGHRANILNNKYTDIGVAVGSGTYNGKTIWMAVQHFGLPKNACPAVNEVLKGMISLEQKQISNMESELSAKKTEIDSGAIYDGMTTREQINEYNLIVNEYNKLILDIKEKIDEYNKEVKLFNSCVGAFTS